MSGCLLVDLSAGLHKKHSSDFHKMWMEDGSQPRMDNFWRDSDKDPGMFFLFTVLTISQGLMHGS